MPRNRSRPGAFALLDRTLTLVLAMLFVIAQVTVLAVRTHAAESASHGDSTTASLCERAAGEHLEALLLKHRPHLLLGGPITRPARQAR